ncbi:MAG: dihydrolipoamide acetyltransferase family protein [Gaiellaceae bacterium]
MPTDVIMPALGMAQETGRLLRWLKADGDTVVKGEPLMEVETDKVTVEVEAEVDGTLAAIRAAEGDDVQVGSTVAVILAAGEERPLAAVEPQPAMRRGLASPKARRMAAELGVDLAGVQGSGPRGAVVAGDLAAVRTDPGPSSVWRVMAERTTRSWQEVPHFYLTREVDAGALERWRTSARRRPGGQHVTHTDLLVRLVAAALREHPRVNSSFLDGHIVSNPEINIGLAVALDEGLVVPVIHNADRLSLLELAERRGALVAAARDGALRPDDVRAGTFTISNLGMFGIDAFNAVINQPQAGILAVGRVVERVVPVDGRPAVRPTLTLTASFDHRVLDGAIGARFLQALAALVEEPLELLS